MLTPLQLSRLVCLIFALEAISCTSHAQVIDASQEPVVEAVPIGVQPVASLRSIPLTARFSSVEMRRDERLDQLMKQVVASTCDQSRKHEGAEVSATIVDLGYVHDPLPQPRFGSWRGDVKVYPASVVKIFYMAAAYVWQREGRLTITPSVYQSLKDMIGPSSNVATQRILNLVCGVSSGSRLSASELREFAYKREAVNRWLRTLGLSNTNANQATWDDKYSPRDMQLVTGNLTGEGPKVNQNKSTSNDIARFLLLIAQNRIGGIEDCNAMRKLMDRKVEDRHRKGYRRIFQDMLPEGTSVWGKSGFTTDTSHDAAIITTADGRRFILVVMAEVTWDNTPFLGSFAVSAMRGLQKIDPDSTLVTTAN